MGLIRADPDGTAEPQFLAACRVRQSIPRKWPLELLRMMQSCNAQYSSWPHFGYFLGRGISKTISGERDNQKKKNQLPNYSLFRQATIRTARTETRLQQNHQLLKQDNMN
jgi:hypothetical protein